MRSQTAEGTAAGHGPAKQPRLAALLRAHAGGLAAALALGALLVAPQWWLRATDPDEGVRAVLSPYASSDEGFDLALYAPNIRQAYDGELPIVDYYAGGSDEVSTQSGAAWLELTGWLGHAAGGIYNALLAVTTLAAAATFVSLYALAFRVTGSRLLAVAVLPIALASAEVLKFSDGILGLRERYVLEAIVRVNPGGNFLAWLRFLPPVMPLAPFFAAAIAAPEAARTGRRAWMAAAVVALTLLVYSYFYFWSAMAAALAGWLAWLLLRGEREQATRLAVIGAAVALLSLPEIFALVRGALTASDDFRARLGATTGLSFEASAGEIAARLVVGAPFLLACLRGPERNRLYAALYVVPLVLSRAVGIVPQPFHYSDQVWPPFAIPAVVAGGTEIWRMLPQRLSPYATGTAVALAGAGLLFVSAVQVRAFQQTGDAFALREDERAAFDWIEDNVAAPETVVSPSLSTNMYVASLTPARRYLREAFVPGPSDDELIEDYLRASAAYGYPPGDVMERLDPAYFPHGEFIDDARAREELLEYSMAFYLLNWQVTDPDRITARIPRWRARYEALLALDDPLADGRRADYVYCGPRERLFEGSGAPGVYVRVAFQQGEVTVYEIAESGADGAKRFGGC
ncbi:MAG TPA: hypothetical protein VNM91_05685 [Dehalococcoidia bacterium]|nr:hypothetical protein [Dehalococcoidia bacterium]